MKTSLISLPNSITLLQTPLKDSASATVFCAVPVGSRHERQEEAGLAHFYEHMVFKGGRRYKTAAAVREALDRHGAIHNAFTDVDTTAYYVKIGADQVETAIDVLSDMIVHARFPLTETNREKGVVLEEHKMYWDMPDARADMQFSPLMFGEAAVGRPIIGNPAAIRSFTPDDLRRWRRHYGAGRVVISVAGRLPDNLEERLARAFTDLPATDDLPRESINAWSDGPKWLFDERPDEQVQLIMGWPGLTYTDERRWIMALLRNILGGYASSRLFTEIREKRGLCYTIKSFSQSFDDAGLFGLTAGLGRDRIAEALRAIKRELVKLVEEPVGMAELNRARDYLKGANEIDLEGSYKIASWRASQWLTLGQLFDLDYMNEQLAAVTPADIQRLARELMDMRRLGVVLVGPPLPGDKLRAIFC